jgi:hypothetical protein
MDVAVRGPEQQDRLTELDGAQERRVSLTSKGLDDETADADREKRAPTPSNQSRTVSSQTPTQPRAPRTEELRGAFDELDSRQLQSLATASCAAASNENRRPRTGDERPVSGRVHGEYVNHVLGSRRPRQSAKTLSRGRLLSYPSTAKRAKNWAARTEP